MRQTKIHIFALCLAVFAVGITQTGCSTFAKMFKKKKSRSQIRREKRAKRDKISKASYDILSKKKDCSGVKEGYQKILNYALGKKKRRFDTAAHLAKCGHWDLVFRRFVASNQHWVNQMLDMLVAAKRPVHKEYDKWLATAKQPYKGNIGWYAFTWTRNWLAKASNPKQHCRAFWNSIDHVTKKSYPKMKRRLRSMMIGYLHMAKCTSFRPKIVTLLTSDSWRDRNQACHFMKDWGTTAELRKLRIIANTDSYFFIRRRVRVYPVRNACRSAFGRVKMRN